MPTKTVEALADLVSVLNTCIENTSKLIDIQASDQQQIAQLIQQRDQLSSELDSKTAQLVDSVDDASTASSITAAAQQLKDKLKSLSDKAAAATPGAPPVTTPSQLPPTGQLPPQNPAA